MVDPVFVLVAPQGAGKSRHAEAIAELLGCTSIVDEWDGVTPLPPGALALVQGHRPDQQGNQSPAPSGAGFVFVQRGECGHGFHAATLGQAVPAFHVRASLK